LWLILVALATGCGKTKDVVDRDFSLTSKQGKAQIWTRYLALIVRLSLLALLHKGKGMYVSYTKDSNFLTFAAKWRRQCLLVVIEWIICSLVGFVAFLGLAIFMGVLIVIVSIVSLLYHILISWGVGEKCGS
jgi:hypothetical protein